MMPNGEKKGFTDYLKFLGAAPELIELVNDLRNSVRPESDGGKAITAVEVSEFLDDIDAIAAKVMPAATP